MPDISDQVNRAQQAGYSPQEITTYLAQRPDYASKMQAAAAAGYSPDEVVAHLAGGSQNPPAQGGQTLTLQGTDGVTHRVQVDRSFAGLSAAEQERTVDEIAGSLRGATTPQGPLATPPGAPPPAPQAAPQAPQGPQDTSFASALQYGLNGLETGLRRTAHVLAPPSWVVPAGHTFGDGSAVAVRDPISPNSFTSSPTDYDAAGPGMVSALKRLQIGKALSLLPRAALETLPSMGAAVIAGGVNPALGAAALTGENLGDNAYSRAAANNRAEPTGADIAGAVPGTLLQTAIGKAGLASRVPGLGTVANPIGRVAAEAAAGGLGSAATQAANTVGTQQGLTVDPAQMAAAGLQSSAAFAAAKAAMAAPRAVTELGKDAAAYAGSNMPVEVAQSAVRVAAAVHQRQQDMQPASGTAPTLDDAADSVRSELQAKVSTLANTLKDQGLVTPDQHTTIIQPAIKQAVAGSAGGFASGDPESLNLPPAISAALRSGIHDLATLNAGGSDGPGFFERLGRTVGHAGTAIAATAEFGPLAGIAASTIGHSIPSAIMGKVGSLIDNATSSPDVLARARAAAFTLRGAGASPGDSPLNTLGDAQATLNDPSEALRLSLGLSPTPAQTAYQRSDADAMNTDFDRNRAGQANFQRADAAAMNSQVVARAKANLAAQSLQERAADQLSGQLYRKAQAARAAGIYGAPAIDANTPARLFSATGGMAGSPVEPSDPALTQPPVPLSTPAPMPQGQPQDMPPGPAQMPQGVPQMPQGAAASLPPQGPAQTLTPSQGRLCGT